VGEERPVAIQDSEGSWVRIKRAYPVLPGRSDPRSVSGDPCGGARPAPAVSVPAPMIRPMSRSGPPAHRAESLARRSRIAASRYPTDRPPRLEESPSNFTSRCGGMDGRPARRSRWAPGTENDSIVGWRPSPTPFHVPRGLDDNRFRSGLRLVGDQANAASPCHQPDPIRRAPYTLLQIAPLR
jgi:hypothetical protein